MESAIQLPSFESIDLSLLSAVTGGEGQPQGGNFLQRWGRNMQSGGEYAMAAGAVGTVVPASARPESPRASPRAVARSWLIGKGLEGVGSYFGGGR